MIHFLEVPGLMLQSLDDILALSAGPYKDYALQLLAETKIMDVETFNLTRSLSKLLVFGVVLA